jgi:hypothetical protein
MEDKGYPEMVAHSTATFVKMLARKGDIVIRRFYGG